MKKERNNNLTQGSITPAILRFSLPFILGNLLQQCYNITDTFIVGRVLGPEALAAVGSSYALMIFVTSIFIGLCMGSGAVISMLYGSNNHGEMKQNIFASIVIISTVTLTLNVIGITCLKPIIHLLQTPPEGRRICKGRCTRGFSATSEFLPYSSPCRIQNTFA